MRRILVPLALGLSVYWFWPSIRDLFRSDEERIAAMVARMEAGYDEGDAGRATGGFAPDWTDQSGLDLATLRRVLVHRFLTERGSEKELLVRAEMPSEELAIALDPLDEDRATVAARVRLERLFRGEWRVERDLEVEAELRRGPRGWEIASTSHRPADR